MRIRHVLLFLALTLTVIPRMSIAVSMPPSPSPFSRQLESNTSDGDMRQSAFDPRGFDSGFWRSESLAPPVQQEQTDNDNPVATSAGTGSATPQAETVRHSLDKTLNFSRYSDNLAMRAIEMPEILGKSELQATEEPDEEKGTTLSDWEYAAVTAAGRATRGSTASGPSATSAIVGFVGIIIVIGAYVSSGNRQQ